MTDRLAEIKHWYALHALPQRRLVEDILWLVNRVDELEAACAMGTCPSAHSALCETTARKPANSPGASAAT